MQDKFLPKHHDIVDFAIRNLELNTNMCHHEYSHAAGIYSTWLYKVTKAIWWFHKESKVCLGFLQALQDRIKKLESQLELVYNDLRLKDDQLSDAAEVAKVRLLAISQSPFN